MPDVFNISINPTIEFNIISQPAKRTQDLIYLGSPGKFKLIYNDNVEGGGVLHEGYNPYNTEALTFIGKNKVKRTVSSQKIVSEKITRGLILKSLTNDYWDYVMTSPLGTYVKKATEVGDNFLNISGQYISLKLPNQYVPKANDYLVFQIGSGSTDATLSNDYLTGVKKIQLAKEDVYVFQIIEAPIFSSGKYTLKVDKSIEINTDIKVDIIALNKDAVGLNEGLFPQTFENIEIFPEKIIGDITSETNHLENYKNADYIGLKVLLSNFLNHNDDNKLKDTPFIVLDIDQKIKDRFNVEENVIQLEFANIDLSLTNVGLAIDSKLGNYSALKSNSITYGYVFFDLRIILITEPETVMQLSYNSNRDFKFVAPTVSNENKVANNLTNIDLTITNVKINDGVVEITTNKNHGLANTNKVTLVNIQISDIFGTIRLATINGVRYIKVITENSFSLFDNIALTNATDYDEGATYLKTLNNYGNVKGFEKKYGYFMTYAIKTNFFEEVLPYSLLSDFNYDVNNKLNFSIDFTNLPTEKFKLFSGKFSLQLIIGEWASDSENNPYKIISYENVYVKNIEVTPPTSSQIVSFEINKTDFESNNDGVYNITESLNNLYDAETMKIPSLKWFLGNVSYKSEIAVYRALLTINVGSTEWNASTNPTYNSGSKYISEVLILDPNDSTNIIYSKICPAIEKKNDLDLVVNLTQDF